MPRRLCVEDVVGVGVIVAAAVLPLVHAILETENAGSNNNNTKRSCRAGFIQKYFSSNYMKYFTSNYAWKYFMKYLGLDRVMKYFTNSLSRNIS